MKEESADQDAQEARGSLQRETRDLAGQDCHLLASLRVELDPAATSRSLQGWLPPLPVSILPLCTVKQFLWSDVSNDCLYIHLYIYIYSIYTNMYNLHLLAAEYTLWSLLKIENSVILTNLRKLVMAIGFNLHFVDSQVGPVFYTASRANL
jgi:hypothetical protein